MRRSLRRGLNSADGAKFVGLARWIVDGRRVWGWRQCVSPAQWCGACGKGRQGMCRGGLPANFPVSGFSQARPARLLRRSPWFDTYTFPPSWREHRNALRYWIPRISSLACTYGAFMENTRVSKRYCARIVMLTDLITTALCTCRGDSE